MLERLIASLWTKKLKEPTIGRWTFVTDNRWPTWLEPMPKTAKERRRLGLQK